MQPGTRRGLQIGGIVCLVIGLPLMMGAPLLGLGGAVVGMGAGPEAMFGSFAAAVALSMLGFVLVVAGLLMVRFGFMKAVSEVTATETAGAVEHASGAVGRGVGKGLADAGHSLGGAVVRLKCRACGYLDSEDASFCSGCGQAM